MSVALNLKFWPDDILTDFIEEILMLLASEIFDSKPRDDMYYYVRVIFFLDSFLYIVLFLLLLKQLISKVHIAVIGMLYHCVLFFFNVVKLYIKVLCVSTKL